jgi:hypothetical protein
MKAIKSPMNAHTPKTKYGMGDNYGTSIKNKVGKMRENSVGAIDVGLKKLKTPPKKTA